VLTARDMDMLAFLALHRECSLEQLAQRFFQRNPFTGALNKNPEKQCARRMRELQAHRYLDLSHVNDGRKRRVVARVAARADAPLDERAARRTISPKERVHHLKTLAAVEHVERSVQRRGGRVVEFRVEAAIRSEAQRGRRTRRGDAFDAFPDAVCIVALPSAHGERLVRVAIEYVTSKYCDADIRAKHESFADAYDEALWFGDRPRTSARVKRITGATCSLLT
jgi:hypothetical protein